MTSLLGVVGETRARFTRTVRDLLINDPGGFVSDPGSSLWWTGSSVPWSVLQSDGSKLAAVNRATNLIVDAIAGVPWHTFRVFNNVEEPIPAPSWIADPQNAQRDGRVSAYDPDAFTQVAFRAQIIQSMLWYGEALIYTPVLDPDSGYPRPPVFLLHPHDVAKDRDGWRVADVVVPLEHVVHVRGKPPYTDEGRGIGVLARFARTLDLASQVQDYAQSTFRSGVPSGYLRSTGPGLTQDQADALKARWMAAHGGTDRQIAVLNATTEFHPLSLSPVDTEMIKMADLTLRDIAHAFDMSAHYLDVPGDKTTYANVQDRAVDFGKFTLLPWARLVESALETRLPVGTSLKLRLEGLERGTLTQRYANYEVGLRNGWLTVADIRRWENLQPIEEGESDG